MAGKSGLDGIVAADTVLSDVDGEAGRLVIRGVPIEVLASREGFEGAAARLWAGFVADGLDRAQVLSLLGRARVTAFAHVARATAAGEGLNPVPGLRAALATLPEIEGLHPAFALTGAGPVFLAALLRRSESKPAIGPDSSLTTAADLLRMLRGKPAKAAEVAALDAYITTVSDHGFNASTFTARVVASTQVGVGPSVVAALAALEGPLHGGAPGPVLDMLDDIGGAENIGPWLEKKLVAGERLMGFGHRVYKVRDPRADVLKGVVKTLSRDAGRLAFAEEVEAKAIAILARVKPGRRLDTNVEFYTALLLEALAIPRSAFTAIFAVGRTAGWVAHALEQARDGRLIRPLSRYVGPTPAEAA
ncbi:MAG: citrate synthase/methylcitrate synthase [Alphaproteobacteria bacterium]|nr:citrate synthase/methylcitrate synthase [Alphaproteobacteria bacterium]